MKKFNVLFVCTGNSCRSQMAEAILNKIGADKFNGYSAGSSPETGKYPETRGVHPRAYSLLKENGYNAEKLHSKSWDSFLKQADKIDFVFTLCDKAQAEMEDSCPVFPGQPMTAHWGVFDPADAAGTDDKIDRVFRDVFTIIRRRIELFTSLPLESLETLALKQKLDDIGKQQ